MSRKHGKSQAPTTLLLGDDTAWLSQIQDQLRTSVGSDIGTIRYSKASEIVDPESDGLLMIAVNRASEAAEARSLVQDLSIQKYPLRIVVLDALGAESPLAALEPYITRRLIWPEQSEQLLMFAREAQRAAGFQLESNGSLEDLLCRRLLANTPSLLPFVDRIALAANYDVTVLLNGETGCGKTFLAKLIHDYSPRRSHRFLAIPCGAIPANLVETEFFGHAKGAFTGADRVKIGKFAAVGEGTLLLDEIDTLGMEQQASLLRILETGEYEPVGSVETQTSKARVIVASNVDLERAVQQNKFRLDLYFRLNVMSFHLPPLRERVMDIAPLARGMVAKYNRKFQKDLFEISSEAMSALEAYAWPGNLRQLDNALQQAVLMSRGPDLLRSHLPPNILVESTPIRPVTGEAMLEAALGVPLGKLHQQRDLTERQAILQALANNGYSRTRAADFLGISRVTLYKKMKKYGLMKESSTV